ncbi:IS110 family transposase [Rhizobium calliandrae]|uniref:IS110 family transposase n=1 Tax=Rhizobium calliandrae TaxID=1312182 RepID=A0ABT7KCY5_9HYPH|nr:IS110 family transposase [Rhizobium calliandrae]MDL2406480.1 IS110 family transposase [Rhizobium calliandrae]
MSTTRWSNDAAGCDKLAIAVASLVVVEATGGCEMRKARTLMAAGIAVAVVNPRQVRDFARAGGRLAKTDQVDAEVILHFAKAMRPAQIHHIDDGRIALAALVARRRQLIDVPVAEKNRLEHASADIAAFIYELLASFKAHLIRIDTAIEAEPDMAGRRNLLLSVPGIGETTAAILIAELPELGSIDDKKLAALIGVAPMAHDSGAMRGQRHIGGGRSALRRALYMAALSAIRCSTTTTTFYTRLCDVGKPPKVAIVAAMRKLATILNTTQWAEPRRTRVASGPSTGSDEGGVSCELVAKLALMVRARRAVANHEGGFPLTQPGTAKRGRRPIPGSWTCP